MKASKFTVKIETEVLSMDSLPGMFARLVAQIESEVENGEMGLSDGDFIKWQIKRENVEF